jgi:quinol monooxygenase YgiN
MNQEIIVFAQWRVKEAGLASVLQLLPELAAKSAAEPGNLFYKAYQDNTDPHIIILSEGYRDEAAINAHRDTAHYKTIVQEQIIPLLTERQLHLTRPLL